MEQQGQGDDEVRAIAATGNKIAAIKRHREIHGTGLAESKQAVEAMMRPTGVAARKGSSRATLTVVVLSLLVLGTLLLMRLLDDSDRPTLTIHNTGTRAFLAEHGGDEFVVQPGEHWKLRFASGDRLLLHMGETKTPAPLAYELTATQRDLSVRIDADGSFDISGSVTPAPTQPPR